MQMPCETLDGPCMVCKVVPPNHQVLLCDGCGSGWHMQCLIPPLEKAPFGEWKCVDCEPGTVASAPAGPAATENNIVTQVRAIQADLSLTEEEKARRIMNLHCPTAFKSLGENGNGGPSKEGPGRSKKNETMDQLSENLKCMICLNLVDRPVTTPCGHNSCLKCFQRVVSGGNPNCPHCRAPIPSSMRSQPRINAALVTAIRLASLAAKSASSSGPSQGPPKPYHHIANENRPDKCFTSERAVKTGKANAASGKIFITVPPDHFGPIPAENDPQRGQGVLVGESWADRMDCRQWGAHLPHVAGIAGQSNIGAQSVCLSGGYKDDEDHGEWFLYTGSGGRDLSGNKRTNNKQSKDQVFSMSNQALRVSCREGYPVRVVRSHKEKRSAYAPGEKCVRYDGVYRVEMCWRKNGIQGYVVCRYLFVRCDNEPAPWLSDEHGDRPRPLPEIQELEGATDITTRRKEPAWGWKEDQQSWGWTRDPPESRMTTGGFRREPREKSEVKKNKSTQKKLLREFGCVLCHKVMQQPLSTPCGHNFCKSCLVAKFAGSMDMRERKAVGGRSLRAQKIRKACPTCKGDITDFMTSPQVNCQLEDIITSLQRSLEGGKDGDDSDKSPSKRLKMDEDEAVAELSGEDPDDDADGENGGEEGDDSDDLPSKRLRMEEDEGVAELSGEDPDDGVDGVDSDAVTEAHEVKRSGSVVFTPLATPDSCPTLDGACMNSPLKTVPMTDASVTSSQPSLDGYLNRVLESATNGSLEEIQLRLQESKDKEPEVGLSSPGRGPVSIAKDATVEVVREPVQQKKGRGRPRKIPLESTVDAKPAKSVHYRISPLKEVPSNSPDQVNKRKAMEKPTPSERTPKRLNKIEKSTKHEQTEQRKSRAKIGGLGETHDIVEDTEDEDSEEKNCSRKVTRGVVEDTEDEDSEEKNCSRKVTHDIVEDTEDEDSEVEKNCSRKVMSTRKRNGSGGRVRREISSVVGSGANPAIILSSSGDDSSVYKPTRRVTRGLAVINKAVNEKTQAGSSPLKPITLQA